MLYYQARKNVGSSRTLIEVSLLWMVPAYGSRAAGANFRHLSAPLHLYREFRATFREQSVLSVSYAQDNFTDSNHYIIMVMKQVISTALIFSLFALGASAQTADVRKKQFNLDPSGLAIQGYDPVAYFASGKALEGKKDISLQYQGATYQFANTSDRDAFKANPGKYEPQYGGWCAYAMGAKGEKVAIDPETFKIVDGKLYLFYNKFFNNTLKTWNKDESHLRANADKNWMKFVP